MVLIFGITLSLTHMSDKRYLNEYIRMKIGVNNND